MVYYGYTTYTYSIFTILDSSTFTFTILDSSSTNKSLLSLKSLAFLPSNSLEYICLFKEAIWFAMLFIFFTLVSMETSVSSLNSANLAAVSFICFVKAKAFSLTGSL